ncbi:hypothetical protein GCM10020358_43490 [Amorphoplanes nipponensis]|uniref:Response regulatory domain-containing protein n=1 Tax=Actinoplanes nipponensis TaxID=135950 RepID=A0A919JVH6_9ACTN|nr:hypothetical protein Ani05nite_72880 [Actinoplanes nipponensis]
MVDDEPALAELLTMALGYEGWDVRSAGTGAEAVRVAAEFGPDAVLLDGMLPDRVWGGSFGGAGRALADVPAAQGRR